MRLAYIDDHDFKLCASLVQDGLRTHASQTLSHALKAVVPALKTMAACVAEMEADKPMLSLAPSMFESVAKALQVRLYSSHATGQGADRVCAFVHECVFVGGDWLGHMHVYKGIG